MNRVAGDTLENQRKSFFTEATAELQVHQKQHHRGYQQCVRRLFVSSSARIQVQQVASTEEVEHLRHELSRIVSVCFRQEDLMRPKVHERVSRCDKNVKVAQLQAHNEFWRDPEPTQYARDEYILHLSWSGYKRKKKSALPQSVEVEQIDNFTGRIDSSWCRQSTQSSLG